MNIVLFINCLYGGGSERVTCNLANYLVKRGHRVEILTMAETDKAYEIDSRILVSTLLPLADRKNKFYNITVRFLRFWKYLVRHKETDIYVVMLPVTTIMLLAFKWMTKAKMVVSERNNPAIYSAAKGWMLKCYAHKADGYVFQTDDACKWYGKSVKKVKKAVIPNSVSKDFFADIDGVDRKHIIISVGRLSKQKNHAMLIRAFHKIAGLFPDYRLEIYGEGKERENIQALIKELKLERKVFLPGNVVNIAEKYKSASIFALSSDYEGMPNALMEAMAMGLPCVSTDCPCGGPKFLIRNGKNGILVPVNDTDAFSAALQTLLSSEKLANSIGREALKVRNALCEDKIYSQWETFISEVAST